MRSNQPSGSPGSTSRLSPRRTSIIEPPRRSNGDESTADGCPLLRSRLSLRAWRRPRHPRPMHPGLACWWWMTMRASARCSRGCFPARASRSPKPTSTEAALALLERDGEVPLIVSDLHMPGRDGQELLREVRRRYPDTAVVMLTGDGDVGSAVECLKIGARDYLSKPVQAQEVRARIEKALEERRLAIEMRRAARELSPRSRTPGAGSVAEESGGVPRPGADGRHDAGGQGSVHPRPFAARGRVRRRHRPATGSRRQPARAVAPGRRTARHRQDRHPRCGAATRRARSTPRNSPRSAATPSKAKRCSACCVPIIPRCCTSFAGTTNGWTAAAFPTAWWRIRFRWPRASSRVVDAFDAMTTTRAYRDHQLDRGRDRRTAALRRKAVRSRPSSTAFLAAYPEPGSLPIRA